MEGCPVDPNIQISVMDESIYEPIEYFDENEELSLDSDTDFRVDPVRFSATADSAVRAFQTEGQSDENCDTNQSQVLFQSYDKDSQSETSEQSCDSRNTLV